MFGLKNRGETLIFMSCHFDDTMTILISRFPHFGALKILTDDYFMLRINKVIYSKQKMRFLIHFSIFPITFLTAYFPHSLCTGWRTNGVYKVHISK